MTQDTHPLLEEEMVINGKWVILDHIATGGKGEVYLDGSCQDLRLDLAPTSFAAVQISSTC